MQDLRIDMKFEWTGTGKRRERLKVAEATRRFEGLEECAEVVPTVAVSPLRREHGQYFERVSGNLDARTRCQNLAKEAMYLTI